VIKSSVNCCNRNLCSAVNKELRPLYIFHCSDFETLIMNGITRGLFG
jgi:hypothetical protein